MKLSNNQPTMRHDRVARPFTKAKAFIGTCWLVLLGLAFQYPAFADQSDAKSLFQEAQRAFRSGNPAQAIALYHQADDAGFADPVLYFNLGVAHYKLGQYDASQEAFLIASVTPSMAPLSFYNLGLVALKQNDKNDAASWFTQVRGHPLASKKLRAMSRKAQTNIKQAKLKKVTSRPRPYLPRNLEKPKWTDHLRLSMNTGFAVDSNVYQSPSQPYVDLSDPNLTTITPTVQSSTYIPLDAEAELRWGTREESHFALRYALDGRIYSDTEFSNADEISQEMSFGGAVNRKTRRGGIRWQSYFIVTTSNEQAYDRDDGQEQFVGTENVSDRFSHIRLGPKAYYHRDIGRFGFGFRADAYIKRYERTLDFLDLTHEQYLAGAHLSFKPMPKTLVQLSGDYYQRWYANREAKDINGIRFLTNDNLKYHYQNLGLTLRHRLGQAAVFGVDYRYTLREDVFENYEDYNRHMGRAYLRYRKGRFSGRASYTYSVYEFPNAFTFDNPTAGARTLDTSYGQLEAEFRVYKRVAIKAEGIFSIVESTDPRTEHDRSQLSLGLIWRM